MSEWREVTLGDVATNLNRRRVPLSKRVRAERRGPFPYYGAQGIVDHVDDFIFDGRYLLVAEDGENLRSRKAPVARIAAGRFWVNNHAHILEAKPGNSDITFLLHATNQAPLSGLITGAAQPKLTKAALMGLRIPCPDFLTQRRIAAVLSAFDEQIEINERRIALLDGVAQATYHNWFPFIPGEPNWPAVPFSQAADFVNGFAFKPPHHSSAGRPIIKIKELKGGVTPSTPRNSGDGIPRKYCVEPGDLLFSWSADLGVYLWPGEPGLLNQHLFLVEPRDGFTREFLFHAIDESLPAFRSRAQGTTMRHIKRSALDEVLVQSPSQEVMDEFTEAVKPVHQETLVLANTNRQLAATRDLLLPRLVTGRLDISEVDLRVLEPAEAG